MNVFFIYTSWYVGLQKTENDVAAKGNAGEAFFIMDVREHNEVARVSIKSDNVIVVPLSELGQKREEAIPAELKDKNAFAITTKSHKTTKKENSHTNYKNSSRT